MMGSIDRRTNRPRTAGITVPGSEDAAIGERGGGWR
ncbi:hypothetical protein FHS63_003158 [Azospirillum doebereinerae]